MLLDLLLGSVLAFAICGAIVIVIHALASWSGLFLAWLVEWIYDGVARDLEREEQR